MKRKVVASVSALVVLMCCAIGTTLAYFTDKTDSIKNTFTIGNVSIELNETTTDYKMVPGNDIAKDPTVKVISGSVDCWLFVKIEKSDNIDSFLSYDIADGWTLLDSTTNIYYREVEASQSDKVFTVIKDNKVHVKDTVTKTMLHELTESTYPKLTFTAYAVQKDNITSAAAAWELF